MKKEKKFYHMQQAFDQAELHAREAVCTRFEPAQCCSHCPIHVDARALCAAVEAGDYDKGLALMRAATPLVHLLAAACSEPCQEACVLQDGIRINVLEQVCVREGKQARQRFFLPRKNQRAAVVGDDLFALTAAIELGLKGYAVDLYTAREYLEEILEEWGLSPEDAAADLSIIDSLKLSHKRGYEMDAEAAYLSEDIYGALCLSPSLAKGQSFSDRIFSGEEISGQSVVDVLQLAKSAALSADRYLQGVQSEVGRKREGAFRSTLYVSPEDIASAKPSQLDTTASSSKEASKSEAQEEATRCIQCECRECISGCAFLQHYKSDPRQTIREVYNNLSIVMGNHMSNSMINSCALCNQCTVTCPFGFDVREVCLIARNTMVETEKMPPSTHEFALLDMKFSNSEAFLAHAPQGRKDCAYLFFPGCQAGAASPFSVTTSYLDLCNRLEGGVGLLLGCCGAIAHWAGQQHLFEETLSQLETAWQDMGRPILITACPTCKTILDEHTPMTTESIGEILERIGLPADFEQTGERVIVRDACGARGDGITHDSVRRLLAMAGYEVQEASYNRDASPCCGWGGLVSFANRPLAAEMAAFDTDPTESYVTYCMACKDRLARAGRKSIHLLEIIYGLESTPPFDLSTRRYNRINLKNQMLKELGDAPMESFERPYRLYYNSQVLDQMEDRLVLESDIYEVMDYMRSTGCAVRDESTGQLSCSYRVGQVTFWVSYTEREDGYEIHRVYSHRMRVEAL